MKTIRVLIVALAVAIAAAGCTARNQNKTVPPVVSSVPSAITPATPVIPPEISSFADEFRSDPSDSRLEDEASGLMDRWESDLNNPEESLPYEEESSDPIHKSEASEISAAATMSTDFVEIGALDDGKLGWGPGGPTDNVKRPQSAMAYQGKYGKYGAYFIAPNNNKIYLTFDEGYENGYTSAILDTLRDKNVKAVFFITYPYAQVETELVTRMVNEGHVLGNHSTKHKSFPDLTLEEAEKDIMTLHDYVKAQYGYEMSLFRPPMGEFSERMLALADSIGYKTVFWSFAYRDWIVDEQPITVEAMDTVTSKCHPGAIYLLHAVSKTNAEILGDAIDILQSKGFEFAKWDLY